MVMMADARIGAVVPQVLPEALESKVITGCWIDMYNIFCLS
jgi:hypothetical protein